MCNCSCKTKIGKYTIYIWLTSVLGGIGLLVGIAFPIVLKHVIQSSIASQVTMTPDSYDTWGYIPGD